MPSSRIANTAPCLFINVAFLPDAGIGTRRTISQADDFFRGEAASEGDSDDLQDQLGILDAREPEVGSGARHHDDEQK